MKLCRSCVALNCISQFLEADKKEEGDTVPYVFFIQNRIKNEKNTCSAIVLSGSNSVICLKNINIYPFKTIFSECRFYAGFFPLQFLKISIRFQIKIRQKKPRLLCMQLPFKRVQKIQRDSKLMGLQMHFVPFILNHSIYVL